MKQSVARLLVLDDEEAVGQTLALVAEDLGFEVRCVQTPEDFFDRVSDFNPSHVAIDLILPGMDGIEVLRRLATHDFAAAIILISGMGQKVLESAQATAAERGLNVLGVLPKPFKSAELKRLFGKTMPVQAPARAGPRIPTPEEVRRAILSGHISIVAQPKVNLATLEVVGAEVLGRWIDSNLGDVAPDVFVAVAEASGLMHDLSMLTLDRALTWFANSPLNESGGTVAVNLSTTCLTDVALADRFKAACDVAKVPTEKLILEITESTAMDRTADVFDTLTRLRLKGFHLSVDDFGTGYSSLAQLARLPLSELKIDRSFINQMVHSDDARKIVDATIRLARGMGLTSVAEGVEDAQVLSQLQRLGCDLAQGYFLSRPVTTDVFDVWLRQRQQLA